jgi:hypothetical protein
VGIYETRSARGNIITNNHLSAKEPIVRRSGTAQPLNPVR